MILSEFLYASALLDILYDGLSELQEQEPIPSSTPRLFSNHVRVKALELGSRRPIKQYQLFQFILYLVLANVIHLSTLKILDPFLQLEYLMVPKAEELVLDGMLRRVRHHIVATHLRLGVFLVEIGLFVHSLAISKDACSLACF